MTVTKKGKPGQLVYGELTTTPPPIDELYQFYFISPLTDNSCHLTQETYMLAKSPIKKLMIALMVKRIFKKNTLATLDRLHEFVVSKKV